MPEENIQKEARDLNSLIFSESNTKGPSNPLNQNVPQNMLKILEAMQNLPEKNQNRNSLQSEEMLNLMKNMISPQQKQVPNIILSSYTPQESKEDKLDEKKEIQSVQNPLKFEDKSSDSFISETKGPNNQNMNEFLLLSKVATMCNQLTNEEKQKKERIEKEVEEEEKDLEYLKCKSKKIKKLNWGCGHFEREHYAKNLCNNCYRKYGRTKKPWNCSHNKLYAHGLCQNCYINKYNQIKKFRSNVMVNPKILSKMNFEGMNLEDINFEHH